MKDATAADYWPPQVRLPNSVNLETLTSAPVFAVAGAPPETLHAFPSAFCASHQVGTGGRRSTEHRYHSLLCRKMRTACKRQYCDLLNRLLAFLASPSLAQAAPL